MLRFRSDGPPMTLADIISPARIIAEMRSTEHWDGIVELVDHLIGSGCLDPALRAGALAALQAREQQRSTGIGGGIAIPHCALDGLPEMVAVFGRSTKGLDFCAVDRAPVHFIVLFLVPTGQHTNHLKMLAAIAKVLNSADTRNCLAEADDAEEILAVLANKCAAV